MINKIIDYLDYLFPNPKCELEYSKDYELLLAIVFQSCRAGSVCLFCSGPTAPSAFCHSGLFLLSCPRHVGIQHQLQAAYRYP